MSAGDIVTWVLAAVAGGLVLMALLIAVYVISHHDEEDR